MSKPRTQGELDAINAIDDVLANFQAGPRGRRLGPNCTCPPWWMCDKRGCHEQAKENYGDAKFTPRTGDPLQADYSVGHDGIYYNDQLAYPMDTRDKK